MRNLTKTLVAVSLLTSTSVHSLGIGGIKLRSALNQKLNAEIALVTSGGENIGDIQVKLASPAKFDEAGVPWSYFLTKIKFTPITKADGSVGVKLSSDEALKEPYLDFLVEVTGPNGTLFREFTVLVDPPASYKKPAVPVVKHYDEPRPSQVDDFEAPPQQVEAKLPVRERMLAGDDSRYEHAAGEYNPSTGEYGPTQKSDTIWSIANQVKPDDVSTEQMVMAIFAKNRSAFAKPNVNRLLAGKMLDIPDHDTVLSLSRHQAAVEFKQLGHRSHASGGAKPHDHVTNAEQKPKAKQVQPEPEQAVVKPPKPTKHLKLNPPTADAGVAADNSATEAANTIANNEQPNLAAVSAEEADLKQRFEKIEQQLQMMQKMLELKDAQLATLQKQANIDVPPPSAELKLAEPVKTEPEAAVANPLATQPPPTAKPASAIPVTPPAVVKVVPPPVAKATPAKPNPPVEVAAANPFADYYLLAAGIGASLLGALGLIWWRKRKVEKTIDTESMFASASQISLPDADKQAVSEHTSSYEVGMVGDSTFLSEFTPSEFDAFETDQTEIDPLSEADVYLAYGRYQQAEELIRQVITEHPNRNDCKLKLLEIFHTSENKPAFDKYVQQLTDEGKQSDTVFWAKVSEIMTEFSPKISAETQPTTSEVKPNYAQATKSDSDFKPVEDAFDFDLNELSDVPTTSERSVKFDKSIAKPQASSSGPALSMGSDIFAVQDDGDFFETESSDFLSETPISDLDFDLNLNEFAKTEPVDGDEQIEFIVEDDNNSLDFDLNALVAEESALSEEDIESIDEDDDIGLAFDLDSFGTGLNKASSVETAAAVVPPVGNFDFVLDEPQHGDKQEIEMFDFNKNYELDESIRDLDFSSDNLIVKAKPVKPVATDSLGIDSESDDFNFDFDLAVSGASKKDKPFDNLDMGDLMDKENLFETKVNLANAYVDMGDVDAAKDIANDLLKGTAEQKKAGKEILEKIS